jgi:hypothetical protein
MPYGRKPPSTRKRQNTRTSHKTTGNTTTITIHHGKPPKTKSRVQSRNTKRRGR